ncbi:Mu-like prophage major head subunit gpT [Oxobacter pfennigii]|uniref:Mu-like prophage major head subunit gpT n=1 Tax=Oxobacter pfennigii TaxID=36849 RepID=A0A0P8WJ71_9CLOT|nr:hypothetical protein [Oxobacter pfennigii]KPU42165.1 Mu-like prophage major head subunit gpT [Oxobacter pfennigii]
MKKNQRSEKILKQQEIVNAARAAGRELTSEEQAEFDSLQREIDTLTAEIAEEERAAETQTAEQRAIQAERQRVTEISTMCRDFEMDPSEFIRDGLSIEQVRGKILEKIKSERAPSPAAIEVVRAEEEKIRTAASDALLMRSGISIDKPAEGARDLMGMRLRDIAIDVLKRAGNHNAHRLDAEKLLRAALTPDSQFVSILSDSVNKSMATAYKAQNTTYQAWTRKGSNPDFKEAAVYQISEAGELVKMTQGGEFKFDEMKDSKAKKSIATFGRSFGLTREAFVNDDIDVLTRVPAAYVRAAGRGINKLVYKTLASNPTIYDNKTLFHADHGNLASSGAVINTISIGEGRRAMRVQKNLRGKEVLNIGPSFLIVPSSLETAAQQFLTSLADPAGAHAGVANVFRNSYSLVVDAELDDYSEIAHYLAASPADIDTIEVTYLNGDEMPKLESRVGFDFLGMEWRIYIDYGVNVLDYRGLYKNPGASAGE